MKTASVILAGIMLVSEFVDGTAGAQQVMDGSTPAIGDPTYKQMVGALVAVANDPFSAQIAGLKLAKERPELVCGLINLKNGYGAYTGFKPFGFNIKYNNLLFQDLSDCGE